MGAPIPTMIPIFDDMGRKPSTAPPTHRIIGKGLAFLTIVENKVINGASKKEIYKEWIALDCPEILNNKLGVLDIIIEQHTLEKYE
jgi:hypothetical protein